MDFNQNLISEHFNDIAGEAEVLQVFDFKFKDGIRNVAGCRCVQGNLQRKLIYKVIRNEEEIFRGIVAYVTCSFSLLYFPLLQLVAKGI